MKTWAFLLRMLAGLASALLLGWGFVEIGEEISDRWLSIVDRALLRLVEADREPEDTLFMIMLTHLGSATVCAVVGAVAALLFSLRGRRLAAWMIVFVLIGISILSLVLKYVYDRPRPDISPLVSGDFASFPSGHTMAATALYGFLTHILVRGESWPVRIIAWAAYTALVLGVGYSRVYLGVHWATDVVGGLLAGTAWLIACISAYEVLMHLGDRRRRSAGKDSDLPAV